MSADEMFAELGYEKVSFTFVERFSKKVKVGKRELYEVFSFALKDEFMSIKNKGILSKQELKAINKKREELGWI